MSCCLTCRSTPNFSRNGGSLCHVDARNFYKSDAVTAKDVRFKNTYGMEVVGTLFTPKEMKSGKNYPALVVDHPRSSTSTGGKSLRNQNG